MRVDGRRNPKKQRTNRMKRYTTILVAGLCGALSAHGGVESVGLAPDAGAADLRADSGLPQLHKGTHELSVGGNINFSDGVDWDLNLGYGYFVADNWEVGVTLDWDGQDGDLFRDSRIGLFTEYNFATGTKWVPYVGVAGSFASSGDRFNAVNNQKIGGTDGFAFSGELGVKYFFRPSMAIYSAINFSWSPDDVFGVADEIKDNVTKWEIGMRFYF